MSRQLDVQREQRERTRQNELVKALEYDFQGVLAASGLNLVGLAISLGQFDCLLTIKVEFDGCRQVSFASADTIMNCLIKGYRMAYSDSLRWQEDKYFKPST
jgi:hypothetical protein